jgi:hypothetical protein
MKEQDFYRNHVARGLGRYGHVERIENTLGSVPDISYAVEGKQPWVETKTTKSGWIYFEKFQIPWFKKRMRSTNGGGIFVLLTDDDGSTLYLFHANTFVEAETEMYRKWRRIELWKVADQALVCNKKPWHWADIKDAIVKNS